jgi:uncharacterized iron-regulated protein
MRTLLRRARADGGYTRRMNARHLREFAPRSFSVLACSLATLLLGACGNYFRTDPDLGDIRGSIVPSEAAAPRALFMFEGETGRALSWADVMAAASWADAIFIGERHDDPVSHLVQLAIYEDLVAGYPGTALALEHLERHEQPIVDRYLRGEISVDTFIDETGSRNWAGKDTWVRFFQPLVDAADEASAPVVAANAPRDYVRRARVEGYDALNRLPATERDLFDLPQTRGSKLFGDRWQQQWDAYLQRFREIMSSTDDDLADPAVRERIDTIFLSQSVWDATMGASAARALDAGAPKVVLCAGCFHIEQDGGTVLQFTALRPDARVLTITVIDASSDRLLDVHRRAADIVIYGFPVDRAKPAESGEPSGAAENQPAQTEEPAQTAPSA